VFALLHSLQPSMVAAECERLKMERSDYRFSRRDVRAFTGWGDTQLKIHLHRVEELEYLLVHRGGRGQSFATNCCSRGPATAESPLLGGLIDVDVLSKHGYDEKKSGLVAGRSGSSRPQVGGVWESVKLTSEPVSMLVPDDSEFEIEESTYTGTISCSGMRAICPHCFQVSCPKSVKVHMWYL
jgi:hypothetical protein